MTTHVYTSLTVNYLAKGRVMAKSVRRYHPDWVIHLVLCEPPPEWFDLTLEPFDRLILLEDLEVPGLSAWVFSHSLVEVCTGVKGVVMDLLLSDPDCDAVVYLDPDTAVFSPLSAVVDALTVGSIVLTPHLLEPEAHPDAVLDNEICSLAHGIYNLGFLAVRSDEQGRRFGRWWRERLLAHCVDDKERGLFTDQRWCDLVPAFFDRHVILRHPAYNVATWNLNQRTVRVAEDGRILVNGEPLAFYHFTGCDSGAGRIRLRKYAPEESAAYDLWDWYERELDSHGQQDLGWSPWRWSSFEDGRPVPARLRTTYRARADLKAAYPDPFSVVEPALVSWWAAHGRA